MTNSNDWLQLCDDVDDGEYDAGLDDLAKAISSRRDIVHRRSARRLQRSLAIKDRVMLTNKVTPRYLEGCTGTVIQMRDGAAVVKLDSLPTHRGRPSADAQKDKLLVPFIHLVKLDEDVMALKHHDVAADIGDDEEYEDDVEELDD